MKASPHQISRRSENFLVASSSKSAAFLAFSGSSGSETLPSSPVSSFFSGISPASGFFREILSCRLLKKWFADYVQWLATSPNGLEEMKAANNHGTCWVMQVAAFANFTDDEKQLEACRKRFKEVLLPEQMAAERTEERQHDRDSAQVHAIGEQRRFYQRVVATPGIVPQAVPSDM